MYSCRHRQCDRNGQSATCGSHRGIACCIVHGWQQHTLIYPHRNCTIQRVLLRWRWNVQFSWYFFRPHGVCFANHCYDLHDYGFIRRNQLHGFIRGEHNSDSESVTHSGCAVWQQHHLRGRICQFGSEHYQWHRSLQFQYYRRGSDYGLCFRHCYPGIASHYH